METDAAAIFGNPHRIRAFAEALSERERQDEKWGPQDHTPMNWLIILMEEVGEASRETLNMRFGSSNVVMQTEYRKAYRTEMIQVAAVALAAIECLDRNNPEGP